MFINLTTSSSKPFRINVNLIETYEEMYSAGNTIDGVQYTYDTKSLIVINGNRILVKESVYEIDAMIRKVIPQSK